MATKANLLSKALFLLSTLGHSHHQSVFSHLQDELTSLVVATAKEAVQPKYTHFVRSHKIYIYIYIYIYVCVYIYIYTIHRLAQKCKTGPTSYDKALQTSARTAPRQEPAPWRG